MQRQLAEMIDDLRSWVGGEAPILVCGVPGLCTRGEFERGLAEDETEGHTVQTRAHGWGHIGHREATGLKLARASCDWSRSNRMLPI